MQNLLKHVQIQALFFANLPCLQVLSGGHNGELNAVAAYHNGLVSCADDHRIVFWDTQRGVHTCVNGSHARPLYPNALAVMKSWSESGVDEIVAVGAEIPAVIELWTTGQSPRKFATLRKHEGWIWGLAVLGDRATLASCSDDRTVRLWDLGQILSDPHAKHIIESRKIDADEVTRPLILRSHDHKNQVRALASTSSFLISGDDGGLVVVSPTREHADANRSRGVYLRRRRKTYTCDISVREDSGLIAVSYGDCAVIVWAGAMHSDHTQSMPQRLLHFHARHARLPRCLVWLDREVLAVADGDAINIWRVDKGDNNDGSDDESGTTARHTSATYVFSLRGHRERVRTLALLTMGAGGDMLVSGAGDDTLRCWDTLQILQRAQRKAGYRSKRPARSHLRRGRAA